MKRVSPVDRKMNAARQVPCMACAASAYDISPDAQKDSLGGSKARRLERIRGQMDIADARV